MPIKERRKFMRISTTLQTEFWAKGPTMAMGEAQIRDFSREGLGLMLSQSVRQGEHMDLTLRVPGDKIPIFATAEVAWSQPVKDQTGIGAGLHFLEIKPLDLARLLDYVYSKWLGNVRASLSP